MRFKRFYPPHQVHNASVYDLSEEEQRRHKDHAKILYQIVQKYKDRKILPRGDRRQIAEMLSVSERYANKVLLRCRRYWADHPGEPLANALLRQKVGRPSATRLTEKQQFIAIFAYLNPEWVGYIAGGAIIEHKDIVPTPEMVHNLLKAIWPELDINVPYIANFLKQAQKNQPGLFTLARNGKEAFFQEFILKKRNNVLRPNIRWQWDARPLPIYILHDGVICTVTLLAIIDDFSRKVIDWILLPRIIRDTTGKLRKADFTTKQAKMLLAHAFELVGVRCMILYNDNGKQFAALEAFLTYLTEPNEAHIEMR